MEKFLTHKLSRILPKRNANVEPDIEQKTKLWGKYHIQQNKIEVGDLKKQKSETHQGRTAEMLKYKGGKLSVWKQGIPSNLNDIFIH